MAGDDPLLAATRTFVTSPGLRPLLLWLVERCDVSGPSGTPQREGERAVGRSFLDLLEAADPHLAVRLAEFRAAASIRRRLEEGGEA